MSEIQTINGVICELIGHKFVAAKRLQSLNFQFQSLSDEEQYRLRHWVLRKFRANKRNLYSVSSYGLKHQAEEELGFYVPNDAIKLAFALCGIPPYDSREKNWTFHCELIPKDFSGFPKWLIDAYGKHDSPLGDLARDWKHSEKTLNGEVFSELINAEMSRACDRARTAFCYAFALYKSKHGGLSRNEALEIARNQRLICNDDEDEEEFADDGFPVNPVVSFDDSLPSCVIDYHPELTAILLDSIALKQKKNSRIIRPSDRFFVLSRDRFTCQYCGAKAPDVTLHIDHVIPYSRGGTSSPENLKTACADCNLGKGARFTAKVNHATR